MLSVTAWEIRLPLVGLSMLDVVLCATRTRARNPAGKREGEAVRPRSAALSTPPTLSLKSLSCALSHSNHAAVPWSGWPGGAIVIPDGWWFT